VDNLNKQIAGTDLADAPLEAIITAAWNGGSPSPAFNNAAQVWSTPLHARHAAARAACCKL